MDNIVCDAQEPVVRKILRDPEIALKLSRKYLGLPSNWHDFRPRNSK